MARNFRIHPALGVARVGNSPDEFFIGPEQPGIPANWNGESFDSFRDAQGRIKRQAARFRVYEYIAQADGSLQPKELAIGGHVVDIEWRVHVANRKASFFTFNGLSGADDLYSDRKSRPGTDAEKDDPGEPKRRNLRNADVPAEHRAERLEIDPGEKLISKASPGPVALTNPNLNVPFIPDLGELRLDEAGRLLFLGGHGISGSTEDPAPEIDEYANNDTWFDDVSDGSVKARIKFSDGSFQDADAAWVTVGPPDFAPSVGNAVNLYDLFWDIAVRELPEPFSPLFQEQELSALLAQRRAWKASGGKSLEGYTPSFTLEIYPIMARAIAAKSVHKPFPKDENTYHKQILDWKSLAEKEAADPLAPDPAAMREYVFGKIRKPDAEKIDWIGMPRGLGDAYDSLYEKHREATALLSFTRHQYALLEQWNLGNFISDWPGAEPPVPAKADPTPAGLDRAAAESCVGGPFYPGIEVSWLIRQSILYSEPFRLKVPMRPAEEAEPPISVGVLPFVPGFFSQQMAQPWQADFYDCHKEDFEAGDNKRYYYMWWTAQRPDDVFPAGEDAQKPWTRHLVPDGVDFGDFESSNERFNQMQRNWHKLRFVIKAHGRLEEEPL